MSDNSHKAVRKSARITAGARQLAEAAQILAGVRIINPPQTPSPSSSNNSDTPTPPIEPQTPTITHNPPTTSTMADLRLQELHTATKFRGFSGLSIADFIIDIESAIAARDLPNVNDYNKSCIHLAKARCDVDVPEVASALRNFSQLTEGEQTWPQLKSTLSKLFSVNTLLAARLFRELIELKPVSLDTPDVSRFCMDINNKLADWVRSDDNFVSKACKQPGNLAKFAHIIAESALLADIPEEKRDMVTKREKIGESKKYEDFPSHLVYIQGITRNPARNAASFPVYQKGKYIHKAEGPKQNKFNKTTK